MQGVFYFKKRSLDLFLNFVPTDRAKNMNRNEFYVKNSFLPFAFRNSTLFVQLGRHPHKSIKNTFDIPLLRTLLRELTGLAYFINKSYSELAIFIAI